MALRRWLLSCCAVRQLWVSPAPLAAASLAPAALDAAAARDGPGAWLRRDLRPATAGALHCAGGRGGRFGPPVPGPLPGLGAHPRQLHGTATTARARARQCETCAAAGVGKCASWGPPGGSPKHCASHKQPGEVNVVSAMCRRCSAAGVSRQAVFGAPDGRRQHCRDHRQPGEIDLQNIMCAPCLAAGGPRKQASYGPPGGRKIRCAVHRLPTDVDLVSTKCTAPEGCTQTANFGPAAGKYHRCGKHKEAGDVLSDPLRTCRTEGCGRIASYGPDSAGGGRTRGLRRRWFCSLHAVGQPRMRNLTARMCEACGPGGPEGEVPREAVYGESLGALARFCGLHAPAGWVNALNRRCEVCLAEGAPAPRFALYGTEPRRPLRCRLHQLEGDLSSAGRREVKALDMARRRSAREAAESGAPGSGASPAALPSPGPRGQPGEDGPGPAGMGPGPPDAPVT